MSNFVNDSTFICIIITFVSYWVGTRIHQKWSIAIFNPLLLAIIISSVVIHLFNISAHTYHSGNTPLGFLLTPATICLALPLYDQFNLLKKNSKALLVGIASGVLTNCILVLIISKVFNLSHKQFVTILPKSVTTAIGIGISEELGGIVSITVLVIVFTGVLGNISARSICRLFKITEPLAQGIGIGTASHVIGTSKALELSEIAGAASSLSIAMAGILTVAISAVLSVLY